MQTQTNSGLDSTQLDTLLLLLEKQPQSRTATDILNITHISKNQRILNALRIPDGLLSEASHKIVGIRLLKKQIYPSTDKPLTLVVAKGKMCQIAQADVIECQKKARKKGEFVESITYKNYRQVNPYQLLVSNPFDETRYLHYALEDSFVVGLELQQWIKIVKCTLDSKAQIILRNNTLFSQFSRLETSQIIVSSETRQLSNGACIYRAGQQPEYLYLILSGTVELEPAQGSDRSTRTSQHVSTLHEMTLFGQVEYLKGCNRTMAANVISSSAKLLFIQTSAIERIIKQKGERSENFKAKLYEDYVVFKDNWRDSKLRELKKFVNYSQHTTTEKKEPTATRKQKNQLIGVISRFLHKSNEVQETLRNQNSILEMHCKYTEKCEPISFSNRLFERADFPQLQTSLRRYENEEKRIKRKLILPRI